MGKHSQAEREELAKRFLTLKKELKLPENIIQELQQKYTYTALIEWAKNGKVWEIDDIDVETCRKQARTEITYEKWM